MAETSGFTDKSSKICESQKKVMQKAKGVACTVGCWGLLFTQMGKFQGEQDFFWRGLGQRIKSSVRSYHKPIAVVRVGHSFSYSPNSALVAAWTCNKWLGII